MDNPLARAYYPCPRCERPWHEGACLEERLAAAEAVVDIARQEDDSSFLLAEAIDAYDALTRTTTGEGSARPAAAERLATEAEVVAAIADHEGLTFDLAEVPRSVEPESG